MIPTTKNRLEIANLEALAAFATDWIMKHPRGAVVALNGELGAGKTAFVQAVVKQLCEKQKKPAMRITSPTYVLHQSYPDPLLEHFDWYRLEKVQASDLVEMGFWEALERVRTGLGYAFVEWAERLQTDEVKFDAELLFEVSDSGRHYVTL